MAVQNPFFGKRDNDSFPSRNSVTGLATANAGSALGGSSPNSGGLGASTVGTGRASVGSAASAAEEMGGSKLTVGPNIKLKGVEITDCDTLVVEGTVEATMDSRVMQIAEQGAFHGAAEIDIAEIHGEFVGNLTVRQKLVIHSTGKVSGKIRYGKIVMEEGGQLSGEVEVGVVARGSKLALGNAPSSAVATSV